MSGDEVVVVKATGAPPSAKMIEKHAAQLCVLKEICNQPDCIKFICADHNVSLILVLNVKTLGEWAGLCKESNFERKAREVIDYSCVVVKN
ncbi:40S ribosomal protein S12 [Vitis vinifera]|uniref:40S ribosomal protein S12 n=2 Tax=Vitis vinifera TaxID=29760 RepID=A0A438EBS6_VITVI|nr:40S ribosomal protein S12 [Vitis vinifera]